LEHPKFPNPSIPPEHPRIPASHPMGGKKEEEANGEEGGG